MSLCNKRYIVFLTLLVLAYGFQSDSVAYAMRVPESAQKPIIQRALDFIELLDQQRPELAWSLTTRYFQKKYPADAWLQSYRKVRQGLGRPLARRMLGYKFHSVFEQAQDGLYLQLRVLTDFAGRAEVLERVVMYKDFDGAWRVIGYFLEFT